MIALVHVVERYWYTVCFRTSDLMTPDHSTWVGLLVPDSWTTDNVVVRNSRRHGFTKNKKIFLIQFFSCGI